MTFDVIALIIVICAWVISVVNTAVPFWETFLPLARACEQPSWVLFFRLVMRFNITVLFTLVVADTAVRAFNIQSCVDGALETVNVLALIGISVSIIVGWFVHPDRIGGL